VEALKKGLDENFKNKTNPDGEKWKPWSPKYAKSRKNKKGSLLVKTGKMKDSFDFKIRGRSIIITNKTNYSGAHQYGTDKIPQRKMVGFGKNTDKLMTKAIRDAVVDILKSR